MEHTGSFYNVTNLTLNLADAATSALPLTNALSSGLFWATEYSPFDILPGVAPVPAGSTNFATFNGMNPNGIWSLYVYDDSPGNDGIIAGGWSLGLTAVSTVNPAALLSVSTIEAPNPAMGGGNVNYQVTVENSGPDNATGVYLTNIIPAGATLAGAPVIVPSGSYTTSGRTVTCNLGTISNGASATVTFAIIAGTAASITNTAIATTTSTDLNLAGSTNVIITPVIINVQASLSATLSGTTLQLNLSGSAGQTYEIQTSTNLISWTTISTNTGSFTTNQSTASTRQRFYRAVAVP